MYRDRDESNGVGGHYEPDFIIKYRKGKYDSDNKLTGRGIVRYIMADAKHKDYNEVVNKDMPELIYKYIDSISIFKGGIEDENVDAKIIGLYGIYNTHINDEEEETEFFTDNAYSNEKRPFARMQYLNISDDEDCKLDWLKEFIEG